MSKTYSKAQNEVEKAKARQRCGNYFVGRGGEKKVLKISHQKTDV